MQTLINSTTELVTEAVILDLEINRQAAQEVTNDFPAEQGQEVSKSVRLQQMQEELNLLKTKLYKRLCLVLFLNNNRISYGPHIVAIPFLLLEDTYFSSFI